VLAGSLDKHSAPQVRQAIFQAVATHPLQIVINLRKVDSLDSNGLSALVAGLDYARNNQVQLCLCDLQSPVRMIFELTRFDKVFDIFISQEDAELAADD
jgi:anti-anti-sigma factor